MTINPTSIANHGRSSEGGSTVVVEERSRLDVLGDATGDALAAMEPSRSLSRNHFRARRLLLEANEVERVTLLSRTSNTQSFQVRSASECDLP